ncbi:hypothetical protein ACJJIQ_13110 [Microbulbifer sp. ANSA003]|uniref:hypothetical protein n=1 Tax=unclassified Microbulbifer TaxID=2619833 RepID=UPI004039BA4A
MKGFYGQAKLSTVFLGYLLLPLFTLCLLYLSIPVSPYSELMLDSTVAIWCVAGAVAIWRCAFNSPFQVLGYFARMISVLLVVVLFASLSSFIVTVMGLAIFGAPQ